MGKCFIVDMRIGIWVTGDQMLFTLSHSPQVQWPSNYVHVCVLPCRCWGDCWRWPSVRWSDTFSQWVIQSAEMKSCVYCCCCCLQVPCSDKICSSVDSKYCYWPDPSHCNFQGHQLTFLTNGNSCLGICKSVTPVLVRGFQSEVTSRCQRKMSLQKRFASSLKLRHRVGCLTAWCDGEEMCRDFPVLLCRESVLLFGGIENVPASTVTTITTINSELWTLRSPRLDGVNKLLEFQKGAFSLFQAKCQFLSRIKNSESWTCNNIQCDLWM